MAEYAGRPTTSYRTTTTYRPNDYGAPRQQQLASEPSRANASASAYRGNTSFASAFRPAIENQGMTSRASSGGTYGGAGGQRGAGNAGGYTQTGQPLPPQALTAQNNAAQYAAGAQPDVRGFVAPVENTQYPGYYGEAGPPQGPSTSNQNANYYGAGYQPQVPSTGGGTGNKPAPEGAAYVLNGVLHPGTTMTPAPAVPGMPGASPAGYQPGDLPGVPVTRGTTPGAPPINWKTAAASQAVLDRPIRYDAQDMNAAIYNSARSQAITNPQYNAGIQASYEEALRRWEAGGRQGPPPPQPGQFLTDFDEILGYGVRGVETPKPAYSGLAFAPGTPLFDASGKQVGVQPGDITRARRELDAELATYGRPMNITETLAIQSGQPLTAFDPNSNDLVWNGIEGGYLDYGAERGPGEGPPLISYEEALRTGRI